MALDVSKFKAGQDLVCTVTKQPKSEAAVTTLERLMRLDAGNKRALRRAQHLRARRMVVYNRGNRDWTSREKPARVVRVEPGATFTLPFTVELGRELAAVGSYLKVQSK
jgi:hypothetical protein